MQVALAAGGDEATYGQGKRVALVMGVSSYEKLPPEANLDSPRTEAARVAAALEQGAGFDQVRLLTDASVTMANVQEVLREQVSKEVQWRDLFFLYFVGQGVGGDFGDPRLLLYDSDPEQIETTTLSIRDLSAMMQKWVPASRYVVMTDAAHDGQVNGLALLGPTGNDWPVIGNQSFIVSSAAPRQLASPGVFSKAVVEALSGAADTNGDGVVSGSELNGFLVLAVPNATGGRQLPTVQSKYNPGIEITRARTSVSAGVGVVMPVSTHRVDRVKFNLPLGSSQRVSCVQQEPRACDPSCYLFDVPAGTCQVSATIDGVEMSGSIDVMYRGAYTCTAETSTLKCIAPPPP
jgi:hypothetical protein